MEKKVLVVGENSFIAKHLLTFDRISCYNFNSVNLSQYNTVINCALNPLYKTEIYKENYDVDLDVGKKTCDSGLHYIMLSTSKVYGNSNELKIYNEEDVCFPYDYYSENKLITEKKILQNYSQQVTILRGSNIFGFEYGRKSFMGYCMNQLIDTGKIELTMNSTIQRDFLSIEVAKEIIESICKYQPIGIYNLSAGIGLEVGKFVKYLIDGYGKGELIQVSQKPDRQFILDNKKINLILKQVYNINCEEVINKLGKKLCKI
jgi:dTDP-4-dehydrorhamnose reductase